MHRANREKIQFDIQEAETKVKLRLEEAIERAVQEVLSTADDTTVGINQQAAQLLQQHHSLPPQRNSWRDSDCKPSPLFPNVDVYKINQDFKHRPTASKAYHQHTRSDDNSAKLD